MDCNEEKARIANSHQRQYHVRFHTVINIKII